MLIGDKFIPEMHLKQPAFTYSECGQCLYKLRYRQIKNCSCWFKEAKQCSE